MKLNQAKVQVRPDIYALMIWQNRLLFLLLFCVLAAGGAVVAALIIRPVPVLLVDSEGRYVADVAYRQAPPLSDTQLEVMAKRFLQHYLSQNSATIYEDAALALAAMCPALRAETRREWVEGGRLARVVERVQVARVVFEEFKLIKYLSATDISIATTGRIVLSSDRRGDSLTEFRLEMALRLTPLTSANYLGIEVCSIKLV